MKNFPEILTENYLLRQITEIDLENIFIGLSDKAVTKYYDISFDSLEKTKEQIDWYKKLEENETGIWWAISSKDREKFFGAIGFSNQNSKFKKADLGFWLLPQFWKNRIMTEMLGEVIQFGFETLELNRIEAQIESENIACKNLIKKFGFQHEGKLREYEIKNGKYIDLEIYSKLKSDLQNAL